MAYKITGSVLMITPAQTFNSKPGKSYTKRDLIITVRLFDQYTGQPTEDSRNTPKFTFFGERCRDLDQFKPGDVVTVSFDISGRAYDKDGKTEYFTEVRPFRVDMNRQSAPQPPQQQYQPQPQQPYQQQQTAYPQPEPMTPQPYQQTPVQPYGQPMQVASPRLDGDLPF